MNRVVSVAIIAFLVSLVTLAVHVFVYHPDQAPGAKKALATQIESR